MYVYTFTIKALSLYTYTSSLTVAVVHLLYLTRPVALVNFSGNPHPFRHFLQGLYVRTRSTYLSSNARMRAYFPNIRSVDY